MIIDYYKMAFEKYADFSTRSTRSEYWYFTLANILIFMTLGIAAFIALSAAQNDFDKFDNFPVLSIVIFGIMGLYAVVAFIPAIAVAVRRLHDSGKSGWWYLLGVVPVISSIGWIVLVIFYCLESERGTNTWGPEPGMEEESLEDALVGFD